MRFLNSLLPKVKFDFQIYFLNACRIRDRDITSWYQVGIIADT